MAVLIFFVVAIAARLGTLAWSKRNEARLRRDGAVEHGAGVSRLLAIWHTAIYLGALLEAYLRGVFSAPGISILGLAVYLVGLFGLVLAIRGLGSVWTVKIMIAPDHRRVSSGIYRWMRHPNYVLGIVPELVGLVIVAHAFWTAVIGLPVYAVLLVLRIRQEERAMRAIKPDRS